MKKIIVLFLLIPLFMGFKKPQEFDEKKMNRDLEIAKNILATLIKSGSDSFFGSQSIEASYIKDYGVVFTIPEHLVFFHTGDSWVTISEIPPLPEIAPVPDVDVHFDVDVEVDEDRAAARIDREHAREEMQRAREQVQRQKEELKLQQKEMKVAMAEARVLEEYHVGSGKTNDINWEEIMITFMTDYADLIDQLQADEKIVINQKSPHQELVMVWEGKDSTEKIEKLPGSISSEVLRKDITAYKSGKINKDEFVKRIVVSKVEPPKKIADLEMFAGIFEKFYSYDLSESYYASGSPWYEVLDGYGVVFHVKAHAPNQSFSRVQFYTRGQSTGIQKSDKSEADEEALYSIFKDDIKNFLLDYGRTIRSVAVDDKVHLEVKIQACKKCKVPKTLEVSTKMSTLSQYDQQKISKDKALNQIEVKEVF
jgi:hypothetical protein